MHCPTLTATSLPERTLYRRYSFLFYAIFWAKTLNQNLIVLKFRLDLKD